MPESDPKIKALIKKEYAAKGHRSVYDDIQESDKILPWYDPSGAVLRVSGAIGQPLVVITPEGLEIIRRYVSAGLSQVTICRRMGIGHAMLSKIRKRQPEVEEAFQHGIGELNDECSDMLLNMARRGNVVAAIYFTKARLGWRDNDTPQTHTSNITIHMPASLTIADLKMLQQANMTPMQFQEANPLPIEPTPDDSIETEGHDSSDSE